MKKLIFLCALAACAALPAQDYNIYFSADGRALLMDVNRADDVETFAVPLDASLPVASFGSAVRAFVEVVKQDETALLRAAGNGLHFEIFGECAEIRLDCDTPYFAWRIRYTNSPGERRANRYITAVNNIRDWALLMFTGEL